MQPEHFYRVLTVPAHLRESIGSIASGATPPTPPPYACNLCGRANLHSWEAARQHVAARHTAELMQTVNSTTVESAVRPSPPIGDVDSLFESALIHIVNCTNIDEAVRIATDALLGLRESANLLRLDVSDVGLTPGLTPDQ